MDQNNKTCPNCNGTISSDVEQCPYCGADVSSTSANEVSSAVSVSAVPVESISLAEEKLPDAFGEVEKIEAEEQVAGPLSDIKDSFQENESTSKTGNSVHIPEYIPTPKPRTPEVKEIKDEFDNLPSSANENPVTESQFQSNSTKTASQNSNRKIWIWAIIGVAVLLLLCLCGVIGFFISFKS